MLSVKKGAAATLIFLCGICGLKIQNVQVFFMEVPHAVAAAAVALDASAADAVGGVTWKYATKLGRRKPNHLILAPPLTRVKRG